MRRMTFATLLLLALALVLTPSVASAPRDMGPAGDTAAAGPGVAPVPKSFCVDSDGDTFSIGSPPEACVGFPHYPLVDCNDANAAIYPGAPEVCNGIDDDCDTAIDEGVNTRYYNDVDADGYGRPDEFVDACSMPAGFSATDSDCDDTNAAVNPGATELCNGIDDNCAGGIDDGFNIGAGCDGVGTCGAGLRECQTTTTTRCSTDPGGTADQSVAEVCANALDDDCDGLTDEAAGATRYVSTSGTDSGNACDVTACATIQHAIAVACAGDTVSVAAGGYSENVIVNKSLTIAGAGEASTTLYPANSIPNACGGSSMCGCPPNSTNLIRVAASNVTITGMTLDGDSPNPLLVGVSVGGHDVNARNGIIEDGCAAGQPFNNTTVHHVTVKNVFLRGIYALSGGSGFNFHHNTVDNVRGSGSSIGMFAFGGSGTFDNNTVTNCSDSISANHSRGVTFTNNHVTCDPADGGSGIHTDNAGDGGGSADLISTNEITDCAYGAWVFVPYLGPTVENNTVNDCGVGLALFGGKFPPGSVPADTPFTGNVVDGATGSVGAWIATTTIGYGSTNSRATLTSNTLKNNDVGLYVDEDPWYGDLSQSITLNGTQNVIESNAIGVQVVAGTSGTITLDDNRIQGNSTQGVTNDSALLTVSAQCVQWGSAAGPGAGGNNGVGGLGSVDTSPYDINTTYFDTFAQYPDADGDGYGDNVAPILACGPVAGYVAATGDCNDAVAAIHPGALELCGDPVDQDCDGNADEAGTKWVATGGSDADNDCRNSGSPCATVGHALVYACDGDTVQMAAGAYAENIVLSKRVVLSGAGSGGGGTSITTASPSTPIIRVTTGGTGPGSRQTIQHLKVTGATGSGNAGSGIQLLGTLGYLSFFDVASELNGGEGVCTNGATVNDVLVTNCSFSSNGDAGLRVATTDTINQLTMTGSHLDGNVYGLLVYRASSGSSSFDQISVTSTTFSNNTSKGIYAEKLSNAVFDSITVANSGTVPTFAAGIDINLKYASYSNIQFLNSSITGSGSVGTCPGACGSGVTIKARNDAPSYSGNPASLTGLTLSDLSISDGQVDLTLGNNIALSTVSMSNVDLGGSGTGFNGYGWPAGVLDLADTDFASSLAYFATILSVNEVNGTAATFGGIPAAAATLAQHFAIADKNGDGVDAAGGGLVRTKAGNVYVTPASFAAPITTTANIQRAIDRSSPGDVLHVQNGLYLNSNLTVGKALTVAGESQAGVVIAPDTPDPNLAGTYAAPVYHGFVVTASNVTIQDLTIDGRANPLYPTGWNYRTGVVTGETSVVNNLVLQNLTAKNIWRRGLQVSSAGTKTTGHVIQDCTVESIGFLGGGYGIAIFEGDTLVRGNTVRDAYDGIASNYAYAAANAPALTVQGNHLERVVIGLDISGQANSLIGGPSPGDGNTVDTTAAVAGVPWGPYDGVGSVVQYAEGQVTFQKNTLTGNGGDSGLWLYHNEDSSKPVIVDGNAMTATSATWGVTGDSAGVFITDDGNTFFGDEDASNYATIKKNQIAGYKRGIQVHRAGTHPAGGRELVSTIGGATSADANSVSAGEYAVLLYEVDGGGGGGRKAVASVTNNRGSFNGAQIGILVDGASATIVGNDILNNTDTGVKVQNDGTAVINGNQIAGNANYGVNNLTTPAINAECNYWGAPTGPGGAGDDVGGNVDYVAFNTYNDYDEDLDGDVYTSCQGDCQPLNIAVNPGAPEVCADTIDNNCDGFVDDTGVGAVTFYRDADGDTFGNASISQLFCTAPSGWVSTTTDCNDGNANVFPNAPERCDGIDNQCSGDIGYGATDEGTTRYADASFGSDTVATPAGSVPNDCLDRGPYGPCKTIQKALDSACTNGQTVQVAAGDYHEDVTVAKDGTQLLGAGIDLTVIWGTKGDANLNTLSLAANNLVVDGVTVTREGNNPTDWNDPTLDSQGVLFGQSKTNNTLRNSKVTHHRNAIYMNNTSGHTVKNCIVTENRTGIQFANGVQNNTFQNNEFTDNSTVGVLFNFGPCIATGTKFFNNKISGNWYGQVVARVITPATLADMSGNWYGTDAITVSTAASTEPGYAAQIPAWGGGSSIPPAGPIDTILGADSGKVDYTPWLHAGTDTDLPLPALGFQGDFAYLHVDDNSAQVGTVLRIQEGHNLATSGGRVDVAAGTYAESVKISKAILMHGDPGDPGVTGPGPGAPVMDGASFSSKPGYEIVPGTSNVTIEGFEIKNFGPDDDSNANGVLVYNKPSLPYAANNVIVRDNYFHHLGWDAVMAWNEGHVVNDNWTITRNQADHNWAYGYELTNTTNSRITFNEAATPSSDWGSAAMVLAWAELGSVALSNMTIEGNTFTGMPSVAVRVLAIEWTGTGSADIGAVTVKDNVIGGSMNTLALYTYGAPTELLHDFTVTGNQLTVTNPSTNYRAVLLDNVGGTSTFAGNTVTVAGTPAGGVTAMNGLVVRGAKTGSWTIGGDTPAARNQFYGNNTTASGAGISMLSTLPATYAGVIKQNDITGWGTGISSETLPGGASTTAVYNNISGNASYGANNGAGASLTANCNWWGASNGPGPVGPGSGNPISSNVTATYWLLANDYGADPDADGYTSCTQYGGYGDCVQSNPAVHPGAAQICDGIDNACVSYPAVPPLEQDNDGDLYVECSPWVGSTPGVTDGGDCNDAVATTYPGAPEACDTVDANCDGSYIDDTTASCSDGFDCTADSCVAAAGPSGACSYTTTTCSLAGNVYYYRDSTDPEGVEDSSGKGVPDVSLNLTGVAISGTDTDVSADPDGDYGFTAGGLVTVAPQDLMGNETKPGGTYQAGISGGDATLIAKFAVGLKPLTPFQKIAGDVSNNGRVTSFDASLIAQWLVDSITTFPVVSAEGSSWAYRPVSRSETVGNSGVADIDFAGILYGDVTANWGEAIPGFTGGTQASSSESDPAVDVMIDAARTAGSRAFGRNGSGSRSGSGRPNGPADLFIASGPTRISGDEWEIVLGIQNADGISALDLALRYDSTLGKIGEVRTTGVAGGMVLAQNGQDGEHRVSLFGATPVHGTGALLVLRIHSSSRPVEQSLFIDAEANEGAIPMRWNSTPVKAPTQVN